MGVKASKKSEKKKAEALAVKDIMENPRTDRDGLTGATWSLVRARAIRNALSGIPKPVIHDEVSPETKSTPEAKLAIQPSEAAAKKEAAPKGSEYVMSFGLPQGVPSLAADDILVVSQIAAQAIANHLPAVAAQVMIPGPLNRETQTISTLCRL